MSSLGMRHPTDEQLLRFADGEMPTPESEVVRGHLKACWQCRNELEEIEQTIGECVRYRNIVVDTCLPSPPVPWFDIYPHLAAIDESQKRQLWLRRITRSLAAVWTNPRRWVPAIATVVLLAVVVQQFRQAPSVQAAELLRKAIVAADSQPHSARRIQFRTRTRHWTRVIGASAAATKTTGTDSTAALESLFQAAHYSWDDPLSAKSYAEWRDQLADKRDEVTIEPDSYLLRTTTDSGELVEATLKLSAPDLHAVEGSLEFRNHELVEITELPDLPAPSQVISSGERATLPPAARPAPSDLPGEVPSSAATPAEELAVLAALHRLGADLGDPIDVTRQGSEVLVTGTGIDPGRQQEIRQELRAMPRVTVRLSSEPAAESFEPDERSPRRISVGPGTGPLQTEIEQRLGGRATFEQFADGVFDLTDAFMARAHALRRLAQRFPPDVEAQMATPQRQLLEQLRAEHAKALLESVAGVEAQIRSAAGINLGDGPPIKSSASWQDQTEQLFGEARQAEAMLVALLGGSPDQAQSPELPAHTVASLAQLRQRVQNYQHLTTGR